ncbi:MAG: desulfoferrodoxin family protein [Negativicutes bacterium]|jgi:hypothetical protein
MAKGKFYVCREEGTIIGVIQAGQATIECGGKPMQEMKPNTTDAAQEKHVPVIRVDGQTVTVTVGSTPHPMTVEHLIEWIYLETKQGGQRKSLRAGDAPQVVFALTADDAPVAAYAYCNLHGLWKAEV